MARPLTPSECAFASPVMVPCVYSSPPSLCQGPALRANNDCWLTPCAGAAFVVLGVTQRRSLRIQRRDRWRSNTPQLACARLSRVPAFATMTSPPVPPLPPPSSNSIGASGDGSMRSLFDTAVAELNFGKRHRQLSALGHRVRSQMQAAQQVTGLDVVLGPLPADTFTSLCVLVVAQSANCAATPAGLVHHPSQMVRFRACTVLQAADAERLFLSADTSRQLKVRIARSCPALPCTDAVMEHALGIGPSTAWSVLQRTHDCAFLAQWVRAFPRGFINADMPGLHRLATRCPDLIIRMLGSSQWTDLWPVAHCSEKQWKWMLPVAQRRPEWFLRKALMEKVCTGPLRRSIARWGWRHQHEHMVAICSEAANGVNPLELLAEQKDIVNAPCPTTRCKIDTIVTVFLSLPASQTTVEALGEYVDLLPSHIQEHRSKDLSKLVDAYWRMVGKLGRGQLLSVQEAGVFGTFASKLPVPLAVEQFFRLLKTEEPRAQDYIYVQTEICKTSDGRYDHLMEKVLESFLQRNSQTADVVDDGAEMFKSLLAVAKSMDVIQSCFDLVARRLGAASCRALLWDTVARMKALDARLAEQQQSPPPGDHDEELQLIPDHTKPLPTAWLIFVPHPGDAPPHVLFLHGTLAVWATNADAIAAAADRFGSGVFWDTLSTVLAHGLGHGPKPSAPVSGGGDFHRLRTAEVMFMPQQSGISFDGAAQNSARAPLVRSAYFSRLEQKKQETFGRDMNARSRAYIQLICDAREDCKTDGALIDGALDDLVPFLIDRLGREQENVTFYVLQNLLSLLDAWIWRPRLEMLRQLHQIWRKARGRSSVGFQRLGTDLVRESLQAWKDDQQSPDEVCRFGASIACVGFPALYTELRSLRPAKQVPQAAIRWLLQSAAPLPRRWDDEVPVREEQHGQDQHGLRWSMSAFFEALKQMAGEHGQSERWAWETWPFVEEWWSKLLEERITDHAAAQYLLVDVVSYWVEHQDRVSRAKARGRGRHSRKGRTQQRDLWWRPLECEAYLDAVERCLLQLERGELPGLEGAQLIAGRCRQLKEMRLQDAEGRGEDVRRIRHQGNHGWTRRPTPWWNRNTARPIRFLEGKLVEAELRTLSKLLDSPLPTRPIQWCVVHACTHVCGDVADGLLKKVIGSLRPRYEGQARCVAPLYPHLLRALADTCESFAADEPFSCDLLTPCMDLWLSDTSTRDARVTELMAHSDAEYLLFFGDTFAEHLASRRQEYLHQCLLRLSAPPVEGECAEFYHYTSRAPSLARVIQLGKGWRTPRRVSWHHPESIHAPCIVSHMWAPQTQAEFLEKGLTSTALSTLAILPRLEFVDGISQAENLLESHPRNQDGTPDKLGTGVAQGSGHYQDVWAEVEDMFSKAGPPIEKNAVLDREADQLLLNLGKADSADKALALLGKYASKFKRAKEAFAQAMPNLVPAHSRRIIKEVGLGPEAGISLQVASLQLVMDLHLPSPLELYLTAWRRGECHRDIAVSILAKLAATPAVDFDPEDVRGMFDVLNPSALSSESLGAAEDGSGEVSVAAEPQQPKSMQWAMCAANPSNQEYIAMEFLRQVMTSRRWHLPFLPRLVASMATMTGCTRPAVQALLRNDHGILISEVVVATADILRNARLAKVMKSSLTTTTTSGDGGMGWGYADLLLDLSSYAPGEENDIAESIKGIPLQGCSQTALRDVVAEVIKASIAHGRGSQAGLSCLQCAFEIWARVLLPGQLWGEHLAEMECEVVSLQGGPREFAVLVSAVMQHVPSLKLKRMQHGGQLIPDLRDFLESILSRFPMPATDDGQCVKIPRDCSADDRMVVELRDTILAQCWADLVAQGSGDGGLEVLLGLCHRRLQTALVRNVVVAAKERLWWEPGSGGRHGEEDVAAAERVARRALRWLAAQDPVAHLPLLTTLWPRVLETDTDCEALASVLSDFGQQPASVHNIRFVKSVIENEGVGADVRFRQARQALEWLGTRFPIDALQLWPGVLHVGKLRDSEVEEVVATILRLCDARGLEVPELPHQARVPAVLPLLASSPMPRARLMGVRMLEDMGLAGAANERSALLESLCEDPSSVVLQARKRELWFLS